MAVVVSGATRKAVLHNTLTSRWLDLQAEAMKIGDSDPTALRQVEEKLGLIRRDELPELGALIRLCHLEVALGDGHTEGLPKVTWLHRLLCHWWDFQTPNPEGPKVPRSA
jgi:hypothetical protein